MRRIAWLAGGMLASLMLPAAAGASGDFGCEPNWKPFNRSYGPCSNSALLSPGNDSRVNLLFLMRDAQAASGAGMAQPGGRVAEPGLGRNFFSWHALRTALYPQPDRPADDNPHYGSRCVSLGSGAAAFEAAVRVSRVVPSAEREALSAARATVGSACGGNGGMIPPEGVSSAAGREFLAYLQGADAFYAERWAAANDAFAGLGRSKDPWLAETARYMLARTHLNEAQAAAFDDYGSFVADKVDKAALARARAGFDDYLDRHPRGRYAASARGLVRRTLWLAGDPAALAREYERMLGATPAATPAAAALVQEIDNKLLIGGQGRAIDGPLLLATIDLMMMREPYEGGPPVLSAAELASQAPAFAGRPDLWGYVQASHAFYVEGNAARVLLLVPDDARRPSYGPVAFSRQVLRGMALAALGDRNEAGFWRELLGGANEPYQRPVVELALAMNLERTGGLAEVFAPASPIGETAIREILMLHVAGPDLLRAQARAAQRPQHERDLALFTLLMKQIAHGDYAGFLRDSALISTDASSEGGLWDLRQQEQVPVGLFRQATWSDGYPCPALAATTAALAADPRDVKARLCLGDFYRLNGFDGYASGTGKPGRDELGGTPAQFPGRPTPRGDFYAQIIADAKGPGADKAYALYRAINCYAPSGNNQCGNADVPQSQRRAWFQRLKRDHASSPWAQKLRYYW